MAITLWFPLMAETCWNPGHGMFTIDQLVLAHDNIISYHIISIYTSLYLSVPGWWFTYPSEKIMEFVNWDHDIPFHSQLFLESHNPAMFQTTSVSSIFYGYSMEFPPDFPMSFPRDFRIVVVRSDRPFRVAAPATSPASRWSERHPAVSPPRRFYGDFTEFWWIW